MNKKILKERFDKAVLFLENREDLSIGTEAYEKFLEEMIDNLRFVKKSAINAMKYLSSKSHRILNNSMLNENQEKSERLSRQDIKEFIRNLK